MNDHSPKPLVGQITAEKAIVAERIEHVHINLTRGLDELPTRYDSRVQNFLEYYLGAKDHPAPFGGRASDLAALDAWLDDPAAPPYASLIAPAGRGKSALLAHWVTRLASRPATGAEAVHVVYFPISIRFNTNLETVVFASLAARMAHVYGEKVTQAVDAQQYRGVFSDYLRRTPPNGSRVLVVLDGLDEAAGWEAGADLFPTVAPGHLRVIVAARPLALDTDATAWLSRLGWEMPNRVQRLSLAGLDREGVRDVLSQMGNPLDALATKIDLITRLYELSAGDPLLVRLYVEALLPQGAQAATLTPDDLTKLQPGLEAYFKRWFDEQQKLWGAAKPLHDKTVRGLLNLCAAALGPLKKDDVLALASDIFEDSGLLDEAAAAVNRFIIGDGLASGYVFSHPRLGEYFSGRLTERERQAWQARFLQYGRDTLTGLENKTLHPKNAPAYFVCYYGAHLTQAKAPATDFYALVCDGWLRAWEWLEGTPAGFLNDADRAWQKAEAEGLAALGQQIRAALCFASVASLSANISKDLLVACVKAGVISPALGLVMARQKIHPKDRAECLAAIAEFHPSESYAIMSEALSVARTISEQRVYAYALEILAPLLPENLLGEALSAAGTIFLESFHASALGALASRFPECEQTDVLKKALSAARANLDENSRECILYELAPWLPDSLSGEMLSAAYGISDEKSRAQILGKLAPWLPESLFGEVLSAAHGISDEKSRAYILGELAPRLPESLLGEMLSAGRAISDKESRASALTKIAPRLLEREQAKVLREALSAARTISDAESRAEVLGELMPLLSGREQAEVLDEALSTACAISDRDFHSFFWLGFVARLPESLFGEALTAVRAISDEGFRAKVLGELASRLPGREQMVVLGEALSLARAISDKHFRTDVLLKLAPQLPAREQAEVFGQALSTACKISSDERSHPYVLGALAPWLPKSLLRKALSTTLAISDKRFHTSVWGVLAPWLPASLLRIALLRTALSTTLAISDKRFRTGVWGVLAPWLPVSLLRIALSADDPIFDVVPHAHVLGALAPRSLLRKVLSAARALFDKCVHARIWRELASLLPESLLRKALSAASAIFISYDEAAVLRKLAPWLPENLLRKELSAVDAILIESRHASVLEEIAPRLPESLIGEVLSIARAFSDESARIGVWGAIAPRLPESLFGEALQMARTLCLYDGSIAVLSSLATRWSAVCRSTQRPEFEELSATLRAFARTKRPQLLQAIEALLPVIAEQGGTPALRETARAIVDTAKWWP